MPRPLSLACLRPLKNPGVWVIATVSSACGGGAPLLHPAHPLPAGEMSAGAGASTRIGLGTLEADIQAGETQAEGGTADSIARRAFIAPGVAPWVAARIGLGEGNEGGITFTGRTLRVDARHAFEFDDIALSVGLGGSSIFARRTEAGGAEGEGVLGFGVDLPLLIGWRSRADIVAIWGGVRPAYENLGNFDALPEEDPGNPAPPASLVDAYHLSGSGLVGISVGLRPIWVRLELAATQHWVQASERVQGTAGGPDQETSAEFRAFSLAPAGALLVRF